MPITGSNFDPPVTSSRMSRPITSWTLPKNTRPRLTPMRRSRKLSASSALNSDARHQAGLRDLLHHALVNQVEELRHAREDRDLALRQRLDQIRRVQRLEIHDAGADRERQQQVGELRERMEQRQHAENRVLLGDVDDGERRIALGQQVRVGQHHAFRIGGGAAGVEDYRWRCRFKGFKRFKGFQGRFTWFSVQVDRSARRCRAPSA